VPVSGSPANAGPATAEMALTAKATVIAENARAFSHSRFHRRIRPYRLVCWISDRLDRIDNSEIRFSA
jgi:hypothetical protein